MNIVFLIVPQKYLLSQDTHSVIDLWHLKFVLKLLFDRYLLGVDHISHHL